MDIRQHGIIIIMVLLALTGLITMFNSQEPTQVIRVERNIDETVDVDQLQAIEAAAVVARKQRLLEVEAETTRVKAVEHKTAEFRHDILTSNYVMKQWHRFLDWKEAEYNALNKNAAAQPDRDVQCTICGGSAKLKMCIVCTASNGKCITCDGSGEDFDALCPTCQGSGHCFYCSGEGVIECPYCDCGTINPNYPPPSRVLSDAPVDTP